MDINLLVKVTARSWSLNILALMHGGVPGRQASLLTASGASRTAFVQSLRHLLELGLLERQPGYGHPLRPEYRLTKKGMEIASVADKIIGMISRPSEHVLLRRAWTIPVLAASQKPRYFTDIKKDLVWITDRALSRSLKQLEAHHWLQRIVDAETRPPRPLYKAANLGAQISRTVGAGYS